MRFLWDLPVSWILLPIKILAVIPFYLIIQVRNFSKKKNNRYWKDGASPVRNHWDIVLDLMSKSPIIKTTSHSLYVNRAPITRKLDGQNHETAHQCMRQGLWVNLSNRISGKANHSEVLALEAHFNFELSRGYKISQDGKLSEFNFDNVSGDMLAGWCMGYLGAKADLAYSTIRLAEHLVRYKGLLSNGKISTKANFKPGFQFEKSVSPLPVGAQNLTYLAVLKCALDAYKGYGKLDREILKLNSCWRIKIEYWLRFYVYLDFLTVLMPTVSIWFKRAYNNDNCCMQFAYVCGSLSSGFEKKIYQASILYTWSLSWPWLNGFFSGMAKDLTGLISDSYMKRCQKYAEDFDGIVTGGKFIASKKPAKYWPIDPWDLAFDEFVCDEAQEYDRFAGKRQYRSTIGQVANLVYSNIK
jgi:hypothetical protein